MGGLIASCVGSCFGSCCCAALSQCTSAKSGPSSRVPYIILMVVSCVFALFMSLYGEQTFNFYATTWTVCADCAGNSSVYRVSFALTIFEFLHVLLIAAGATAVHYSWFAIKVILYIAGVVAMFFVKDVNFFVGWADVCRILSAFFLVIQVMILITWAYEVNDKMTERAQNSENGNCLFVLLMVSSLGMFIAALVLIVFFYIWYGGLGCIANQAVISIALLLGVLGNIGLSVWAPQGSIFTAGIVAIYTTYLAWAAVQADPSTCNPFQRKKTTLSIWIGIILTIGSLCYMGWSSDNMDHLRNKDAMNEPLISEDIDANVDIDPVDDDDRVTRQEATGNVQDDEPGDEDSAQTKRENLYFHVVMMLAACYMAMLFTNWGTGQADGTTQGKASYWVNVVSQWITILLYYWTLVAQRVMPDRFED